MVWFATLMSASVSSAIGLPEFKFRLNRGKLLLVM
jgi:hypothetical protein